MSTIMDEAISKAVNRAQDFAIETFGQIIDVEVAKAKIDLAVRSFFHRVFDSAEEAAGVALEHYVGRDRGQNILAILVCDPTFRPIQGQCTALCRAMQCTAADCRRVA